MEHHQEIVLSIRTGCNLANQKRRWLEKAHANGVPPLVNEPLWRRARSSRHHRRWPSRTEAMARRLPGFGIKGIARRRLAGLFLRESVFAEWKGIHWWAFRRWKIEVQRKHRILELEPLFRFVRLEPRDVSDMLLILPPQKTSQQITQKNTPNAHKT